jgi:hypothetical protein
MDQNRNTQNPERDRNRSDQGGAGNRDDQTIGQQRDRNQGGDAGRDQNDVNSSRNRNQGDRSSGGGSQTNR